MKHAILFSAALAALFALTGCDKGDDSSTNTNNTGGNTSSALEAVYADSTYQFTGIAKDPSGSTDLTLINYPRWSGPYKYGIVNAADQSAFPNEATNMWLGGESGLAKWVCVQSVYFDRAGGLWVLDPASPNMALVQGEAKLVRINKTTGAFEKTYFFDSVINPRAYLNDVRVDPERQFAYITNSNQGGIVVLNLATGQMRQVLTEHYSVHSDPSYTFVIDGKELRRNGQPVKIHSDGIALTPDGTTLYYKPTTDDKLYSIPAAALRDFSLNDAALSAQVTDHGRKCSSDGMIMDDQGRLYLTDVQNYRIVRIDPANNHAMTTVAQDNRLIWPDTYAIHGGYLYVTISQIHRQPDYNDGVSRREGPYMVYRVKL